MKKLKILAGVSLIIFLAVGWFVPFDYNNEGYCSESPLYRYRFGVWACEYNAEAGVDFQCWDKKGGFLSYIGIIKLDCETQDNK